MPFSKLPNLTRLSLRGCPKMKSSVPYLSLACRFGFQKLEVFDLRETNINDGELQCLNVVKSLKAIYLEYPEVQPTEDESDDDEDYFRLFFRAPTQRRNRRARERPSAPQPQNAAVPEVVSNAEQNAGQPSRSRQPPAAPQAGATRRNVLSNPTESSDQPSTSRQSAPSTSSSANLPSTSSAAPVVSSNETHDSDSDSFSDSISSSSSDEEPGPTRTILIRANINPGAHDNNQLEPRIQVIINGEIPDQYLNRRNLHRSRDSNSLSDRGILSFGVPRTNLIIVGGEHNVQVQEREHTQLERIILRNYSNITDATLTHLEVRAPRLNFLDVRGCNQITREAVERFKTARENCTIVTNYDFEE